MRAAVVVFVALASLLAGCGGEAPPLWAPPPPLTAGAQGLLFVLEADRAPVLFAAPAEDGRPRGPIAFDLPGAEAEGADVVTAYVYAEPLTELGLEEGRVTIDGGAPCALDHPLAAFRTSVPSDGAEWRPTSAELPATVRDALFGAEGCAAPDLCLEFTSRTIPVDRAGQPRAMLAWREGVLLADNRGRFWTVTATGATRRRDLDDLPARSLARAGDGELWWGGGEGQVAKGPLEGPYERFVVGTSTRVNVVAIAESPAGEVLALTLEPESSDKVTQLVEVHLDQGSGWRRLYSAEAPISSWRESDVAWGADGRAILVYGGFSVLVYDGDRVRPFDLRGLDVIEHVASAAVVSSDGTAYVGARFGLVLAAAPPYDSWSPLGGAPVPTTIQALATYRGGLLVGSTQGFVGQHHPDGRPCDGRSHHEADIHSFSVVGDDVFVAGVGPNGAGAGYITYLSPLP